MVPLKRRRARALRISFLVLVVLPFGCLMAMYLANWKKEHAFDKANQEVAGQSVRVVFLGDSITALWTYPKPRPLFSTHPDYVNRGIGGDHAALMLFRIRHDVFELKPQTVVFLGGINDLKAKAVPNAIRGVMPLEVESSIRLIADLVEAHHERLILCSLTPTNEDLAKTRLGIGAGQMRTSQILEVNAWIKAFAQKRGLSYVDYYSALQDGSGHIRPDLTDDGLHPNDKGFEVMGPIVEHAIEAEPADPDQGK
jgi:lysophospholipase L1-like esterase